MYFPGKAQAVCKQDRHGRFPRIVNVPSDLFNSDVNFPSFTRSNNVQKTFLFSRVFLHKKMTEKQVSLEILFAGKFGVPVLDATLLHVIFDCVVPPAQIIIC